MTREDKQLLLTDLCGRLPYGVKMLFNNEHKFTLDQMNPRQYSGKDGRGVIFDFDGKVYSVEDCKPYLRPMDSMTEEECDMVEIILGDENIFDFMRNGDIILKEGNFTQFMLSRLYDYFNSIHVDYRGLIPNGLAIEATEDVYEHETKLDFNGNDSRIGVGCKIRSKTSPNEILSIISDDCHGDEFECSNGSVLSLKQIEKYYDIIT